MKRTTLYVAIVFFLCFCESKQKANQKLSLLFSRGQIVENKEAFDKFQSELESRFRQELLEETKENNKKNSIANVDSIIQDFNTVIGVLKNNSRKEFIRLKALDSLILFQEEVDGRIIGDYTVVSTNNLLTHKLTRIDSTTKYRENIPYQYLDKKILELKEFPNQTETIKGFNCFKVIMLIQESYYTKSSKDTVKYELYVTKELNLKIHPFFKVKQILDEYYPLEIKKGIIDGYYEKVSLEEGIKE